MTKKFYFESLYPGCPSIEASKKVIPEWYRELPRALDAMTPAVRSCVPFMDTFLMGYQIPLIADVLVTTKNDMPFYSWKNREIKIVDVRNSALMENFPKGEGYESDYPTWITHHAIRIPKGYSALLTHPLNRFDLPFTTMSGIVDDYDMHTGRLPFFLKKGFTGVIPQGTPIVQVLFIKQESWKVEEMPGLGSKSLLNMAKVALVFTGWYKKNIWKKKSYE